MLSPDGEWLWNGSEWIPSPPTKTATVKLQPLPNLGTAYVLNFFFPGIGMLYLGRPTEGIIIYSFFLFFSVLGIIFQIPFFLLVTVLLMIGAVVDTKQEYSKAIRRIND